MLKQVFLLLEPIRKTILAIPPASEAEAENVLVPEIVEPLLGLVIETVGAVVSGAAPTVTVTESLSLPALLEHEIVNVVSDVKLLTVCDPPLIDLSPLQPPEAGQLL